MQYELAPMFVVRLSGFSIRRLDALTFPKTLDALRARDEAGAEWTRIAAEVEAALDRPLRDHPGFDDPATRDVRRRHLARVRKFAGGAEEEPAEEALLEIAALFPQAGTAIRGLPAARRRARETAAVLQDSFDREVEEKAGALREIYAGDPRLREAVFLESTRSHGELSTFLRERGPRNRRARTLERLAIMYLQRFCAKNDTNSMCGPHSFGFLEEREGPLSLVLKNELAVRRTYFSFWAAEALHRAFAAAVDPRATMPLRRNPALRREGASFSWCVLEHDATHYFKRRYAKATLPEEAIFLWEQLERPRTAASLSAGEDADALLEELLELGVILDTPSLPVGLFDPLAALCAEMEHWPPGQARENARQELANIRTLIEKFASAELPERVRLSAALDGEFERVTQTSSTRAAGQHYADRALLHEDCYAEVRACVPPALAKKLLADLQPLVEAAALPMELARENVRHWFREELGENVAVSALEAHKRLDNAKLHETPAPTARAAALLAAIDKVRGLIGKALARPEEDGVARIDRRALAEAVASAPGSDRPSFASADVMLAKRGDAAAPLFVLGEMHGFFLVPNLFLDVVPEVDRERALRDLRAIADRLAGGVATAEALFLHTQANDRRFPVASHDLWMIGPGGRPEGYSFGELTMSLEGDRFRFHAGTKELVPMMIYSTYPFWSYTSPLAPLIDDFRGKFFPAELIPAEFRDADAPRLAAGELVFRRRSWVRKTSEFMEALDTEDECALFAGAQRLRAQLACPRHVFASVSGEPKPLLVDFDNFFLVRAFARLLKRPEGDARVRLTEMLPGPGELLLEGPDGPRTFELRMGVYRIE